MPTLHGPRKQHASKFARRGRRQCMLKEDPNVAAFPGTGTFQSSRDLQLLAGLQERQGVVLPRGLVEIRSEKPARFVGQEWVNANGLFAQEVLLNDGVGQREE